MRFKVQAADPETGEEVLWEIEAPTVQAARQQANDSGYLVGRVRPCSDSGQSPAIVPLSEKPSSEEPKSEVKEVPASQTSPSSPESPTPNWIAWGRAVEWTMFVAAIVITLISFVVAGKSRRFSNTDWEFSRAFVQGFLPCVILLLSTGWLWFTEAATTNRPEFEERFDHPRRVLLLAALALSLVMSFVFDPWDEYAEGTAAQMLFGFVIPFAMLLAITVLWVAWLPKAIVDCRGTRVLRRMRDSFNSGRSPTVAEIDGIVEPDQHRQDALVVAGRSPTTRASGTLDATIPPLDTLQGDSRPSESEVSDARQIAFWPTGGEKWQPPGTSARAIICAILFVASVVIVQTMLQIPSSVKLVPDQTANALWHGAIYTVQMFVAISWPMWLYRKMQIRASKWRHAMVRALLACADCLGEFAEDEPKHIELSRTFKCGVAYCVKCRPSST